MAKPTIARTEFASALNQVAHERNLDPQVVVDAIQQAILAAFKKDHPDSFKEDYVYEIDLDPASGEARIHSLPGESYEEDGIAKVRPVPGAPRLDITPPGFGRIAAMTAKQVIYQKVREAEKSNIVAECEKRLSTLINGTILRVLGGDVIVEIDTGKHGRIEAVMPRDQQVHSEDYHPNQRLTFLLHSIRDSARGREVVVSRADTGLIRELFRREVPEVNSGSVEVKAISRDPGSRTKIAVYSHQSGVDPVGSCVGQKGVRVQAVISELNGEKIDVIQFSEDLERFVATSLAPASNLQVAIDSKKAVAEVTAPADQLSLAIGREGQNAKLAGRLVNLHIDIRPEKGTSERKEDSSSTDDKSPAINDQ
ncbi:transcription termination factor NusA [Candidatus Amesbacteria bacterium RIFCSPLOWO2_01_FULL_49_25]|uniref:Transcription termination/antitermination protein NusA n=1 Tax=Candidatus Amesbacteria bacterium RIFCSPHIGHO2_01_FULL_48_32b TaxID=1797253 RepID=A0A1F4YGY6_9BACT|nr:MAG: transcription termination factor NusA [Candidatus Amesbacteria bacterium RIFCSPHIGHO2_01_FULL_48_32b]OGD07501.1 MAG: transcription termination factor NusA [Candidatus Amesbacteria bacterium RIFCSPLOWO2_01_FULL_49_25]